MTLPPPPEPSSPRLSPIRNMVARLQEEVTMSNIAPLRLVSTTTMPRRTHVHELEQPVINITLQADDRRVLTVAEGSGRGGRRVHRHPTPGTLNSRGVKQTPLRAVSACPWADTRVEHAQEPLLDEVGVRRPLRVQHPGHGEDRSVPSNVSRWTAGVPDPSRLLLVARGPCYRWRPHRSHWWLALPR